MAETSIVPIIFKGVMFANGAILFLILTIGSASIRYQMIFIGLVDE
jgi:hypothetical protein